MNIGNQIKALRLKKSVTQEAMAEHFGMTAQAVSKWECGTSVPDISLLPKLSAYFGVTIDALFALDDETRMERIRNMLWDVRYLNPADVENERAFLLEKARREPENGKPYAMLTEIENQIAQEHHDRAADYAKSALEREPDNGDAHGALLEATKGCCHDWGFHNHNSLIRYYEDFLEKNPNSWRGIIHLFDQLVDDCRYEDAACWLEKLSEIHDSWRVPMYHGILLWKTGKRDEAYSFWQELIRKEPNHWQIQHTMADHYAMEGQYDNAIYWHRKALEISPAPRYTDPFESMAQIYEIRGQYDAAIGIRKEQLVVVAEEWHITQGETVDEILREIARLKKRL